MLSNILLQELMIVKWHTSFTHRTVEQTEPDMTYLLEPNTYIVASQHMATKDNTGRWAVSEVSCLWQA